MHIKTKGTARVRHKDTGEEYEIDAAELDWDSVSSYERDMGPETLWAAEVHHSELGTLRWEMSEYPQGLGGQTTTQLNGHKLLQDVSVSIAYEYGDSHELDDDEQPFDRDAASEEMREWFYENYEDPANSLPYNSREGGYLWINGGPFTPLEALGDHFGGEYPWDFIEEVADSITNDGGLFDWTPVLGPDFYGEYAGPEIEAAQEDEAELLSRRMPLAEELVQSPVAGVFDVRPKEITKPDLLGATLGQVADTIDDVLANQSNGLNDRSYEIRKLRRTLERYANDPQRIEMDLTTVHGSLTAQIASGELPPSNENAALLTALQECAQGIRATEPQVAENRRILQEQALRELPQEALKQIADAAPILESITEGRLREQMQEDVFFLTEEMRAVQPRLPGVTRADGIIPGRDEAVRVFGRSARMLIAIRKPSELVHKLHDSAGIKLVTIISALCGLIKLGLSLFF